MCVNFSQDFKNFRMILESTLWGDGTTTEDSD